MEEKGRETHVFHHDAGVTALHWFYGGEREGKLTYFIMRLESQRYIGLWRSKRGKHTYRYSIKRLELWRYTGLIEEKGRYTHVFIMRLKSQRYTGFMKEKGRETHTLHQEDGVTALHWFYGGESEKNSRIPS